VGHPQQAQQLQGINRGIVTETMSSHTPGARMVCSAIHSTKAVVSQAGALWAGLQACGD